MKVIITLSKYDMSGTISVGGVTERFTYSMSKAKYNMKVRALGLTGEVANQLIRKAHDEKFAVIKAAIDKHGYCSDGHLDTIKTVAHTYEYEI